MQAANAILAIDSLDRYTRAGVSRITDNLVGFWNAGATIITIISGQAIVGATLFSLGPGWPVGITTVIGVNGRFIVGISQPTTAASGGNVSLTQNYTFSSESQPVANTLISNFSNNAPYCNDFTISSPAALIYGYIDRIVVTQIQLQYNIPTVCVGKNDIFVIAWNAGLNSQEINIPFGFYTPDELAAMIQTQITAIPALNPLDLQVTFTPEDGFIFNSVTNVDFYFPSVAALLNTFTTQGVNQILKCCKLLGMTFENSEITTQSVQASSNWPNFLYTPYIDIYSDVLTNYQNVKDTNTSIAKPKGLVARILLSGSGNLQLTTGTTALGSAPFVMTVDLNSPKIIQWSPDVAVPSIDFQLRDCYGELIPGAAPPESYPTEFQMTLLCIEGQR